MFGVFRYAARHALPVKKSLPFYAGHLNNTSNKLDPLTISEGVEVAIELRCLNMFNIIVCHTALNLLIPKVDNLAAEIKFPSS